VTVAERLDSFRPSLGLPVRQPFRRPALAALRLVRRHRRTCVGGSPGGGRSRTSSDCRDPSTRLHARPYSPQWRLQRRCRPLRVWRSTENLAAA
jgi:hypothetical protein